MSHSTISCKVLTEKGIVKKHVDYLGEKKVPRKVRFIMRCSYKNWTYIRNETIVDSPVAANNTSQNICDPSPQCVYLCPELFLKQNRLITI